MYFCRWRPIQKTHAQPNLRTNSCKSLQSRTGIVTAKVSRWLSRSAMFAVSRSYCVCKFIQMSVGISMAFSKATATFSDTLRLPLMVSLRTEALIPVSAAKFPISLPFSSKQSKKLKISGTYCAISITYRCYRATKFPGKGTEFIQQNIQFPA